MYVDLVDSPGINAHLINPCGLRFPYDTLYKEPA